MASELRYGDLKRYNGFHGFVRRFKALTEVLYGRPGLMTRLFDLHRDTPPPEAAAKWKDLLQVGGRWEKDMETAQLMHKLEQAREKSPQHRQGRSQSRNKRSSPPRSSPPRHKEKRGAEFQQEQAAKRTKGQVELYHMEIGVDYDDTIRRNPPIPKQKDRRLPLPKKFKGQCQDKGVCCNCFGNFHGYAPCDATEEEKAAAKTKFFANKEARADERAHRERSRTPVRQDDREERKVFVSRGRGGGRTGRGGDRRGDRRERSKSRERGPPEGKTRWQDKKS